VNLTKQFLYVLILGSTIFSNHYGCAFSLFQGKSDLTEVELTSAEMAQVEIMAGWAPEASETLIFSIKNKLVGPISCAGATVHLKNGKTVNRGLSPKLYVPTNMAKQFSVGGVSKETLKDYSVTCSCSKKSDSKICVNPLADKK
jgi:hypothetical protein